MTRDYVEGRRARFANPVQVYAWCTALFFLLHAYAPLIRLNVETGAVVSSLSAISIRTHVSRETLDAAGSLEGFAARFDGMVTTTLPILLIVLVAASAFLLKLLFWRRNALTHVVFALHWSSFYFVLETLRQIALIGLGAWGGPIAALGSGVILIYVAVALHVVYASNWIWSALCAVIAVLVFAALLGAWLWSTGALAEHLA